MSSKAAKQISPTAAYAFHMQLVKNHGYPELEDMLVWRRSSHRVSPLPNCPGHVGASLLPNFHPRGNCRRTPIQGRRVPNHRCSCSSQPLPLQSTRSALESLPCYAHQPSAATCCQVGSVYIRSPTTTRLRNQIHPLNCSPDRQSLPESLSFVRCRVHTY